MFQRTLKGFSHLIDAMSDKCTIIGWGKREARKLHKRFLKVSNFVFLHLSKFNRREIVSSGEIWQNWNRQEETFDISSTEVEKSKEIDRGWTKKKLTQVENKLIDTVWTKKKFLQVEQKKLNQVERKRNWHRSETSQFLKN